MNLFLISNNLLIQYINSFFDLHYQIQVTDTRMTDQTSVDEAVDQKSCVFVSGLWPRTVAPVGLKWRQQ